MQTFNTFDDNKNEQTTNGPTWEEFTSLQSTVSQLQETIASYQSIISSLQSSVDSATSQVSSLSSTVSTLSSNVSSFSSSIASINNTLSEKLQFPLKSINLSTLLGWKESDGRIRASTMMTNLIGSATGDVLVCIRNNSTSTGRTYFYENSSNYRSMFLIGNLRNYGVNADFWLDGSLGGEFDVTWNNQTPTADTYATTWMFFSRH